MNMRQRDLRDLVRMEPEERAWSIKGKGVVLTLLSSFLLLSAGSMKAPKICTGGMFLGPIIAIGLFLMVMFVVGSCGVKRNDAELHGCYLLGLLLAILLLLVFVIFGYVAVGGIELGHADDAREYNLKDSRRSWLRGRVTHSQHLWATTSACLRRRHVCDAMTDLVRDPNTGIFVPKPSSFERWAKRHGVDVDVRVMSPIESGCCKPPSSCGLTYVNGTTWISTPAAAGAPAVVAVVTNNDDCSRWSNDRQTLCFQCDSCKAGFLHDTSEAWSVAAIYIIIVLIIGVILSSLPLCVDQVTGNNARSHAGVV